MRDFDMHRQGRGHHFGGHRMAKPLLMGAVIIAALGLLVMSLWNALLPEIIGVKDIGFWQAIGLLALCRILFGGLGFRPGMFGMARRRMHERWMQMTPEQREEFMQHRRKHFHRGHHDRCDWRGRRDDRAETPPHSDSSASKPNDAE